MKIFQPALWLFCIVLISCGSGGSDSSDGSYGMIVYPPSDPGSSDDTPGVNPPDPAPIVQPDPVAQPPACSLDDFASFTGAQFVALVNLQTTNCINSLFSVPSSHSGQIFSEAKMVLIADELARISQDYQAVTPLPVTRLALFLRAGYYVQFYYTDDVGDYGTSLSNAIRPALDNFFASPGYRVVSDSHGSAFSEMVTLADSAGEQARYLYVAKDLLQRFNRQAASFSSIVNATNAAFYMLSRGHYSDAFTSAVFADSSILNVLQQFILNNEYLDNHYGAFVINNAAREMGRFLQHEQLRSVLRPKVKALIDRYSLTSLPRVWLGLLEMVDYYDNNNCDYYQSCSLKQQLIGQILPVTHRCSTPISFRGQSISIQRLNIGCSELIQLEQYFHLQLATGQQAIAGDRNNELEVIVYSGSDDYATYSAYLYGNPSNNGGIYLEGDPEDSNNQARFFTYESYGGTGHGVHNLLHEYVHYLDGRFNMQGGFSDYLSADTVWWLEGLAEYISKKNYNAAAISQARTQAYSLATVFSNDYYSGQDRVYRWGYLAVRFMFERHPEVVTQVLSYFRAGDYAGYTRYLNSISNNFESEWQAWLLVVQSSDS